MQYAMLIANAHGLRRMHNVFNVFLRHFFFRNGHHADFILAADMLPEGPDRQRKSGNLPLIQPDQLARCTHFTTDSRSFTPPLSIPRDGQLPRHDIDHTVGQNFPY